MPRVLEQGKQFQLSYKTSRWNAFLMFSSSWDRNSRIHFPRLRRASSQRTEDCIKFSGNYSHGKGCFDRSNLFAESLWIDRSSLFSLFIFNLRMLFAIPLLRDIFIMKILNGFIFLWIFFFNITFLLLLRMIYENIMQFTVSLLWKIY